MRINRVLDYYYRAYDKTAAGQESGRSAINALRTTVSASARPARYARLSRRLLRLFCGPFFWPNTFPNAVDRATAELLYSLTRLTQPEISVEIGTSRGNSAIAIGQALEDNGLGRLHTCDPNDQEIVRIAIDKSRLRHRIDYIVGHSSVAIPALQLSHIDFCFIDGDHDYEAVRADYELVRDRIPTGGLLVFHDTTFFEGPRRVVDEVRAEGLFECVTLPTLSGRDSTGSPVKSQQRPDFVPTGVTICRRR